MAKLSPVDFRVPPAIHKALGLRFSEWDHRDQIRGLARAKHEGFLDAIPALADAALAALEPVNHDALIKRLSVLGAHMPSGRDAIQIRAWLNETARLLADLPHGVVNEAIDECLKEPGRVFLPSVGEIRAKAAPLLSAREREAIRLRFLAKLIAEGAPIPDWVEPQAVAHKPPAPPEPNVTPAEAAAILAEIGLPSAYADKLKGFLTPAPTRQQMVAQGQMPPALQTETETGWDGMP